MKLKMLVGVVCVCLAFCGCSTTSGGNSEVETVSAASGQLVYLKNNIHAQIKRGGEYHASYANHTAPGPGHHIFPVNTPVVASFTGRGFRRRHILLTVQSDGNQIHFECNERNVGMSMDDYVKLITSPTTVSIKGLSRIDQKGIEEGKALIGMSKEGVRIALGYPSPHRTPSLASNSWIYWTHRHNTIAVDFDDQGKVKQVRQ